MNVHETASSTRIRQLVAAVDGQKDPRLTLTARDVGCLKVLLVDWDASVEAGVEQEQELQELQRARAELAAVANAGEFGIVALHACDIRSTWIQVHHVPCAEVVFGGTDDAEDTDAGELLARMAAHRCDAVAEPRDVSQMIGIDVAGDGTVTAVVHGSRALDDQEQEAMAEILRATRRMEREKRQEAARQRDEDVRAVTEVVAAAHAGTPMDVIRAARRLGDRFDDRIADFQQRNAEGPVSGG